MLLVKQEITRNLFNFILFNHYGACLQRTCVGWPLPKILPEVFDWTLTALSAGHFQPSRIPIFLASLIHSYFLQNKFKVGCKLSYKKMDSLEFNFKETDHYLPMQENRQQQHLALELLSVFFEVQLRNTSHILPYNITYLTHDPRTCPDESTLSPSVRTSLIKNPTLTFQSHCLILVSLLFLYAYIRVIIDES